MPSRTHERTNAPTHLLAILVLLLATGCAPLGAGPTATPTWAAGEFVAVYGEFGLSPKIMLRRAPTPVGPWGAAQVVYACPEAARDPANYCYAGKGHAGLAVAPDELLITYVAQGTDDARLYFPHFVRVQFAKR